MRIWKLKSRWWRPQSLADLRRQPMSVVHWQEECYRKWQEAPAHEKHLWVPA